MYITLWIHLDSLALYIFISKFIYKNEHDINHRFLDSCHIEIMNLYNLSLYIYIIFFLIIRYYSLAKWAFSSRGLEGRKKKNYS